MDKTSESRILQTHLGGQKVTITNLRAIIEDTTYSISNVTSVQLKRTKPKSNIFQWLLVIAGVALVGYGVSGIDSLFMVGGLIVGGVGILFRNKATYTVQIGSSSGVNEILESKKKKKIKQIVDAINEAIIRKG